MSDYGYPRELEKNLEYRFRVVDRCRRDDVFRAMVARVCASDLLYWINVFCWTHDPRCEPSVLPFITYPFQDKYALDLVDAITTGKNLLVEKSRDMGVSWLTLMVFQWFWQFGPPGSDFHLGSDKEMLVDHRNDPRALFHKLRFNVSRQPLWLLPRGYDHEKHSTFLRLVNPETGSAITGESNNPDFSRGGRYRAVLYDEFAYWRHTDAAAWRAGSDSTPCKIAVSSANGRNNHFYRLRSQQEGHIDVVRLHWSLHPYKNRRVKAGKVAELKRRFQRLSPGDGSPSRGVQEFLASADGIYIGDSGPTELEVFGTSAWYEGERLRRSREDLASEVDIDYSASVSNRAAEAWKPDLHIRPFDYNPDLPLELCCDFNIDPMCWNVAQTIKGETYTFREYTEGTALTEVVIRRVIEDFARHKCRVMHLYGDPAGRARSTKSARSDWQIIRRELRRAGWEVHYHVATRYDVRERVNAVNKRLWDHEVGKAWEFVTPDCPALIESIEATQRDASGGILKNGVEHHFDAWSYRIVEKHPVKGRRVHVVRR